MIEERIKELGIELPNPPKPKAVYVPTNRVGHFIYTSGMSSIQNGVRTYVGRLGEDISVEEGYQSARLCAINALAALKQELGNLDKIKRIVKLNGYVRSAHGFGEQPKVVNGASDLLEKIFGERGKHARTAIGVNELPFGISVEVEMIVEVDDTDE
jgi:enamine deaminase RidA (YjgF/YER057c/UK114 family)